ncbi:MAG: hypothetical protein HRT61_24120, partial [Ekhidna sp.]|nr:hypothetical protein [Ekhidna sp.]
MISKTTSFTLLFFYTLCSFSQDALPTFSEQKLVLNGEWKVVMYDFVDPADLTTKDNSIPLNVPSTWNELIWDKQKVGSFGFATYFKQFIYTGDLQNTQLSIEVPEISLAYKLFANEDLIAQVGTPGETAQESKPRVAYQ